MFDEVGLDALGDRSLRLTAWLRTLLNDLGPDLVEVVTPVDPESHGAQLSLRWLAIRRWWWKNWRPRGSSATSASRM